MLGKIILNYEIKSLIGEGGMGAVYFAQHVHVNRKVAIKALLPQYLKNQEIRTRFKNEASMMAHLKHPNIVSMLDYHEDESGMYLIMELVEGKGLDDYISQETGPMPEDKAIPIIRQILEAFSYAHSQKVVHRDIKPGNILITSTGNVKILDFGIARIIGDGVQNLTKTGTQMGTVFYMSPEQVQGKRVDHLSDIYSLGVTFYQMFTGLNPYRSLTTEFEVYSKIVNEPLPNPQEIYPGVPDYMVGILDKALKKDTAERFQSCEEFLKAINSQGKGLSVPPVNPPPVLRKSLSKNNAPKIVIGIILFLLFLAGLSYCNNRDRDGDGVKDSKDECPELMGEKACNGCPDSDYDGVKDTEDDCPNEQEGDNGFDGCPDNDGDGIHNYDDECPDEAQGDNGFNGCPDSDGDQVLDKNDECPNDPGSQENSGCPYITRCPSCSSTQYAMDLNTWKSCEECGEQYYLCKRRYNGDYGVSKSWFNDGECDCENCEDESN
jgi:serine/threonine protein kinase